MEGGCEGIMSNFNKVFLSLLLIIVSNFILSCSKEKAVDKPETYIVKKDQFVNRLFYSGSIEPIATRVIPSPAEGVVIDMVFQYGDAVKKGDLLFKLSSSKFLADYKNALLQYVKAKNEFNTAKNQLSESKFLYENELIPKDEYNSKQASYYAGQLSLVQAKDALDVFLKQMAIKNIDFYNLTIADTEKISKAIHMQMANKYLHVFAPTSGVILSSIKDQYDNKKIKKGDMVKEGDVLAIVGDMSGLAVHIKVSELTINQIKIGDKVKVSGIAFPGNALQGVIKQVDRQGEASMNGLPTFPVVIQVEHLTKFQQKAIHVGMSAKVEMVIHEKSELVVPIKAIHEVDGKTFVSKKHDNRVEEIAVSTGKTTQNNVEILSGLKAGDEIVFAS